jgi:hypothetical protein
MAETTTLRHAEADALASAERDEPKSHGLAG